MSEQTQERSLDQLARALASGSLSRGKALRLMGGLLLGGTLGSLPGVAWANDDDRCPEGQTRCGERCVNLKRNERHCGSCFNRCRSTQTCCNGNCVNLQRNERHCGSCFHRCAAGEECVEGVCTSPCVSNGLSCRGDSECCSSICDEFGTCVSCRSNGGSCAAGETCCSGNCANGTCCGSSGGSCNVDRQCCSGLLCDTNGKCATCRSTGGSCSANSECC